MERKSVVLLLSFATAGSFFFPVFSWNSFGMSGPNYILSIYTPSYKYFLLLVPLISAYIFLQACYNDNFVFTGKLISWLPLSALVLVFMVSCINEGFAKSVSKLAVGFWMILLFSILLALVLFRKPARKQDNGFANPQVAQ